MGIVLSFSHCPICGGHGVAIDTASDWKRALVNCNVCGTYSIELTLTGELLMATHSTQGRARLERLSRLIRKGRAPAIITREIWQALHQSDESHK